MKDVFQKTFKEKTRDEWCAIFADVDACVEPVYDIYEMCSNEQVKARGMIAKVPLSLDADKAVEQIGNPVKLSESPVEYRHTAYPIGYNTKDVLNAFGFSAEDVI